MCHSVGNMLRRRGSLPGTARRAPTRAVWIGRLSKKRHLPRYASNLPHLLTPLEGVCDTHLFQHVMRDEHLRKGLLEKILNISFLRYVDGKEAEGAFTKEIDAAIKEIKEHAEVRREYMTL